MDKLDIVRTVFGFSSPDVSASLLADDFQATDALGSPPMDKDTWIGMGEMLRASLPDIDYVIEDIREEGDGVKVVGHFVGSFTNDLDLSPLGMEVIPASGKVVRWPSSTSHVTVEGGKVTRSHSPDTGPDAGLPGFLKALGAG